jgi:hypothetical protein
LVLETLSSARDTSRTRLDVNRCPRQEHEAVLKRVLDPLGQLVSLRYRQVRGLDPLPWTVFLRCHES